MGSQVIQEHVAGLFCVFCGRSLMIGDDCGIANERVVEEGAGELMDTDTNFIQERGNVGDSKLGFLSLCWSIPAMSKVSVELFWAWDSKD